MNDLIIEHSGQEFFNISLENIPKDINFCVNEKIVLTLKEDGFYYNNQVVNDAGEAHKLFTSLLEGNLSSLNNIDVISKNNRYK